MKHIANYTLDEFKEICSSIPYYIVEIVYAYYHRDKSYTIVQFAMSKHISVATLYRYKRQIEREFERHS